jgi:hypothetical protein
MARLQLGTSTVHVEPGDLLVYSGKSPFSFFIRLKTYSRATHVAVYIGAGEQREFREFRGAEQVPVRTKNLIAIYRPLAKWSHRKSQIYWDQVKDQTYDYLGVVLSFIARKQGRDNKKMFCSEYVVRDQRVSACGPMLIADHIDADGVAPADIDRSPNKIPVWRDRHVEETRDVGFRIWDPLVKKVVGDTKGEGEVGSTE